MHSDRVHLCKVNTNTHWFGEGDYSRGGPRQRVSRSNPRRIKVVESKTAPKVDGSRAGCMAVPANEGRTGPLKADDIVEIPDDNLRAKCVGNPGAGLVQRPIFAVLANRGKQSATKYQCATRSWREPRGHRPVTVPAGRSPSYTMRQLFDMKTGARARPMVRVDEVVVTEHVGAGHGRRSPSVFAVYTLRQCLRPRRPLRARPPPPRSLVFGDAKARDWEARGSCA